MSHIYFIWSNTLHVSDGLSVHHQEFKTVRTATGICQTDTAVYVYYVYYDVWPYERQITLNTIVTQHYLRA